ncbi:putative RNA 2'-phosphotransferase [Alkalihalobacillus xiaoxiensis]|uniref:RNA 2'-phosphotransferase n=1 Tax=Shouchella xiaoxiensis TaxID=766895 RepID=A0ABS2SVI0_9BACI|nr:putative RNA 2'-phosphotransferase [Shouchella xiaoxiensis]
MDVQLLEQDMCRILRHTAPTYPIRVDSAGFCKLEHLVVLLKNSSPTERLTLTAADIIHHFRHNRRYEINSRFIRARYGHSFIKINYEPSHPPACLYHGTSLSTRPHLVENGILPMGRAYVYLAEQAEVARSFAKGPQEEKVVLTINTERALFEKASFFNIKDGIWLCAIIKPDWLSCSDHFL